MKAAVYDGTHGTRSGDGGIFAHVGALFRQDPARRTLRYAIPIAIVVAALIRFTTGSLHEGDVSLPVTGDMKQLFSLVVQLWIFNLMGVVVAHFNSRCSLLSLGLPLSPRKLWVVRVVSVFGAGAIPIAIAAFIVAQGKPVFASPLDGGMLRLGARVISGLALAVVLFQLPSPGVYRIAGSRRYSAYVILVSVVVLAYTVTTPQSWIFTALPLAAALALAAGIFSSLPRGFTVFREPLREATIDLAAAGSGAPVGVREIDLLARKKPANVAVRTFRLHVTVWRSVINTWPSWLMLTVLGFYGWGLTYSYIHGVTQSSETFVVLLWFWILLNQSIKRLHRVDPLPVSRKIPFGHTVLTGLAVALIGAGVGYTQYRVDDNPPTQVCYEDHRVVVPREFWEIARDGRPPEVVAPWGESFTPRGHRPLTGHRMVVYNPYETGEDNSVRFIKFQIDRALAAIYGPGAVGEELTVDTPLDRSFVDDVESGNCSVTTSEHLESATRSKTVAVSLAILAILFALIEVVWMRRYRPEAKIIQTRWFAILFFSVPQLVMLGATILEIKLLGDAWAIMLIPMILIRKTVEALPVGAGGVWIFALAVAIVSYFFVRARYEKAEAPMPRTGKNLLSEY